jgi:hypothetical protein
MPVPEGDDETRFDHAPRTRTPPHLSAGSGFRALNPTGQSVAQTNAPATTALPALFSLWEIPPLRDHAACGFASGARLRHPRLAASPCMSSPRSTLSRTERTGAVVSARLIARWRAEEHQGGTRRSGYEIVRTASPQISPDPLTMEPRKKVSCRPTPSFTGFGPPPSAKKRRAEERARTEQVLEGERALR